MIAVPVKTNKENPVVTPLFGKAKWFAFIADDTTQIVKTPMQGGVEVAQWLLEKGIDTLVFAQMGATPYAIFAKNPQIKLYHAGFERILLNDLLKVLKQGKLKLAEAALMQEVLAHHEGKHSHTHEGHHHRGGHHAHHNHS